MASSRRPAAPGAATATAVASQSVITLAEAAVEQARARASRTLRMILGIMDLLILIASNALSVRSGSQIVMHGQRQDYPAVHPITIRKLHKSSTQAAGIPSRTMLQWAIQGREHGHRAGLNGEMGRQPSQPGCRGSLRLPRRQRIPISARFP